MPANLRFQDSLFVKILPSAKTPPILPSIQWNILFNRYKLKHLLPAICGNVYRRVPNLKMIFFFLDSVVILVQQVKIEILGNSSVSLFPLLMATITIVLTPIVNGLKRNYCRKLRWSNLWYYSSGLKSLPATRKLYYTVICHYFRTRKMLTNFLSVSG